MERLRRVLDWKFLIGLAAILLILQVGETADAKDARIAQLVTQSKKDHALWDSERDQASEERREILQGQADLNAKYRALLEWVNSLGTPIPEYVLNPRMGRVSFDNSDDDSDSSDSSEGSGKQSLPKSDDSSNTQTSPDSGPSAGNGRSGESNGGGSGKDSGGPSKSGKDKPAK